MATAILLSVVMCFALSVAAEDPADLQKAEMFEEETFIKYKKRFTRETEESNYESCWMKHGSRFFVFVNRKMTWTNAEKYCMASKTHLASIHSPAEHAFIQELVRNQTGTYTKSWIGGTDAVKNGEWFWSDGSTFNYHDWAIAQPDNKNGNENCLMINYIDDHLWNDGHCEDNLSFICGTRPEGLC